jgi:predicted ester cyclase
MGLDHRASRYAIKKPVKDARRVIVLTDTAPSLARIPGTCFNKQGATREHLAARIQAFGRLAQGKGNLGRHFKHEEAAMRATLVENLYRAYIACLNEQDWPRLAGFVHVDVRHNGRPLGVDGYRAMLQNDFANIPDLHFEIDLLVANPHRVGSRLRFDCSPRGEFLGLPVNGRRIVFAENVFYEIRDGKIAEVWSVIDKAAIEAQL